MRPSDQTYDPRPPSTLDSGRRTRLRWGASDLVLVLLIAVNLAAVWSVLYLPSQDGPAHVDNVNILIKYHRAELISKYYALNPSLQPTWLTHLLLLPLVPLVTPPVAVKVLASLYLVLFPVALRYAARGVARGSGFVALLGAPLALNLFYAKGFYNFCFGLTLYFVLVGYWLRRRECLTVRHGVVLGGMFLLLYLCHPVALLMGCVTLGVLALWFAAVDRRNAGKRLLISLAAPLPALLLVAAFFVRETGHTRVDFLPLGSRLKYLVTMNAIQTFCSRPERLAAAGLFVVFAGSIGWTLWRKVTARAWNSGDGLLVAALAGGLVYLVTPDEGAGGGYVCLRLSLFLFPLALLWLAGQEWGRAARRVIPAATTVASLLIAGAHFRVYRAMDPLLRDYLSAAEHIAPNSTILSIAPDDRSPLREMSPRVYPFHNAAGYLAVRRDSIDLRNYQGSLDHFPTFYRPALSPVAFLAAQPPDIAGYVRATSGRGSVDYVLLWSAEDARHGAPLVGPDFAAQYSLCYTSPRRLLQLYRRRDLPDDESAPPALASTPAARAAAR